MLDGRIHPVTLRFASPELEAAFQADLVERSVWLVRASILLAISQFAVFGILDPALAPESAAQIRAIRLVMCLVSAGIFVYTFTDPFRRHFQASMAATGLFGGLAIVAMIPVSGTVATWTPSRAGVVALATADGASRNVSVRFDETPISGLLILIVAGLVLFGGAALAMRALLSGPAATTEGTMEHWPDT